MFCSAESKIHVLLAHSRVLDYSGTHSLCIFAFNFRFAQISAQKGYLLRRVSFVALTSPYRKSASWIIRVRIAFAFSLLIFVTLKLALNKAICSDEFRLLRLLHSTENPLEPKTKLRLVVLIHSNAYKTKTSTTVVVKVFVKFGQGWIVLLTRV